MNQADIKRTQIDYIQIAVYLILFCYFGHQLPAYGFTYLTCILLCVGFVWNIVGGNITDAIHKMIRGKKAKNQFKSAQHMFRSLCAFQIFLGLLGGVALFASSNLIADKLFGIPTFGLPLRVLSPILFLYMISAYFKGYMRAEGADIYVWICDVIRLLFVFAAGNFFLNLFGEYGDKVSNLLLQEKFAVMYRCTGLAVGCLIAELACVLMTFIFSRIAHKHRKRHAEVEEKRKNDSFASYFVLLVNNRGSSFLNGLLFLLPGMIGIVLYIRKNGESAESLTEISNLTAGYLIPCVVISLILWVFVLPIVPKILSYMKRDEKRIYRNYFRYGVHITFLYSVFWMVIGTIYSIPISGYFEFENSMSAGFLTKGSILVVLITLWFFFATVMNKVGGQFMVVLSSFLADIGVLGTLLIIGKDGFTVQALWIAILVGFLVGCLFAGILTCRRFRAGMELLGMLVVPVGIACVMGLFCMLLRTFVMPHVGETIILLAAIVCSAVLYWLALLLLHNVSEEELKCLVGGKYLKAVGELLKIF